MVVALMKFQKRPAGGRKFRPEIDLAEQEKRLRGRVSNALEVFSPVTFTNRLVEVLRANPVLVANPLDLPIGLVRNGLVNEKLAPCRRGRRLHRPLAE